MKREPSKVNGRAAHEPAAAVTTKREREATAPPPPPPELLVLESCFLDGVECSQLLLSVPVALLLEWEALSTILKQGLAAMQWWERYFAHLHPVAYARIMVDTSRATTLLQACHGVSDQSGCAGSKADLWRDLVLFEHQSETRHRIVWREQFSGGSNFCARFVQSIHPYDEYGVDCSHQLIFSSHQVHRENSPSAVLRAFTWGPSDSVTLSYFDLNQQQQSAGNWPLQLMPLKSWTIPFRNAALVLLQHSTSGLQELIWVKTEPKESKADHLQQDLRFWVLNRNVMLDNEDDFVIPSWSSSSSFDPDASIDGAAVESEVEIHYDPVLVAATSDGCLAVVIGGDVVLIFDQQQKEKKNAEVQNWRDLLTAEFVVDRRIEPRAGGGVRLTVTAACYVLDSFLLLATSDGVLRAYPRNNPKSEYYVENLGSLVSQLVSLYNVVAVIHSYCILEVRLVTRIAEDPFMRFDLLYRTTGVDCEHPPLLYGPYVIFAGLDGCWYRVLYDTSSVGVTEDIKPFPIKTKDEKAETKSGGSDKDEGSKRLSAMDMAQKEEIRIPYHAGWRIVSIKNANWRYWTLVVQEPTTGAMSELLLFANGAIDSQQ
jgi:hypothetical protein